MLKITLHELKMLIEDYHPEFENTSKDEDKIVEQGKGSDVIYGKKVKRKSDGEIFYFEYVVNTTGGFVQDFVHSGAFEVDTDKEDLLDPYNELPKNIEEKVEEEKPLTNYEQYLQIEDQCSPFNIKDLKITPEDYDSLLIPLMESKTLTEFNTWMHTVLVPMAIKYLLNVHELRAYAQKVKNNNKYDKESQDYKSKYNKKFNILKTVIIQGQKFELTVDEVNKLKKELVF